MVTEISAAYELGLKALKKTGFNEREQQLIITNLMDAQLSGKPSHGLVRIPRLKTMKDKHVLNTDNKEPAIVSEKSNSILVDGFGHTALTVIPWMTERAISKCKSCGICAAGTSNTAGPSGRIGFFSKMATDQDLISIGFNSSPAGLTPFGSRDSLWGTNPFTAGVPVFNKDMPVILDMASAKMTFGQIMMYKALGKSLPSGVSVNKDGNPTTDPEEAFTGSQLPFEGHKGSGLAFIVELLAGPLINTVRHGWGSLFILINPEIFRPIDEFKKDVDSMINELKSSRKAGDIKEIYYPGEKSGKLKLQNVNSGKVEIADKLMEELMNI